MLTSHELIGFMSPNLANEILAYAFESDKPLYKATMQAVAEARKLRPVYLERQPKPARHSLMLATLARPSSEMITANLLRTWLLKKHQALLAGFLDALGIPHKEGVVEDLPKTVDDAKLKFLRPGDHLSQQLVYSIGMHASTLRNTRAELRAHPT